MCIGYENSNINVEGIEIQNTNKFKYIRPIISNNGSITEGVENKIHLEKAACKALHDLI